MSDLADRVGERVATVLKDAAFEARHPRDRLTGRFVVLVDGHGVGGLTYDFDEAVDMVARAHREGSRVEVMRPHTGGLMAPLLTPAETRTLARAAARRLASGEDVHKANFDPHQPRDSDGRWVGPRRHPDVEHALQDIIADAQRRFRAAQRG